MGQHHVSSSSSQSSAYANSQGAGGSSRSSATSPTGETSSREQSAFVPGATSASASASATASDQGATTSATVSVPAEGQAASADESTSPDADEDADIGSLANTADTDSQATGIASLSLLICTPEGGLLVSTPQQDIFWGGSGANIFQLSATGVTDLSQADIILDFSSTDGDFLSLSGGATLETLVFDVIDVSGDGRADSTVLRSSIDHSIVGVVLNSVDDFGASLLSSSDFTGLGDTEITAIAEPGWPLDFPSATDIVTGTHNQAVLVGGEHSATLVSHGEADLVSLSDPDHSDIERMAIILDFPPDQGTRIQCPETQPFSDSILEFIAVSEDNDLSCVAL